MSEADRLKWDARYSTGDYVYGAQPAPLLVEQRALLPDGGRALDIACGEGRNAVYLAKQGFEVDAIDISAVGLRKARELAEGNGVEIRVGLHDLEQGSLPEGPFDVVLCIHYKQRDLVDAISEALAPGGVLVVEIATVDNLELHKHPSRRFLVARNELLAWFPTLRPLHYREGVFHGSHVAQLIAQKPSG
ncbi:MAG: methyltransferase domain-containing protein [Myxococcales bacterium]|nr:methyltransferase domain-containing protein [Myxococcales bacterium]